MTILPAGTFRVSDYRKPIPERVKRAALVLTARSAASSPDPDGNIVALYRAALASEIQFDHRPPLQDRPYDTDAGDFQPPQNDPLHIDAVPGIEHLARSIGAPGRTERGDADRRKRVRKIANAEEDRRAARAAKVGLTHERRTDIPPPTKRSQKPKAKILGRGFQKRPKKEKPRKPPVGRFS